MKFREEFILALKGGLRKGESTFKTLAKLYDYPQENGENLCKKDYYKFLKAAHEGVIAVKGSVDNNRDNSNTTPDLSKYNLTTFKIDKEGKVCDQWYKTPVEVQESIDYKTLFKEAIANTTIKLQDFVNPNKGNGDKLLVINATDVHLNKKCFTSTVTLDQQIATFKSAIGYSVDKSYGTNKILFIIGHDFLHSEFKAMTTKGTPQDTLESFEVLFKKALQVLIQSINYCATVAPTDVVLVNGNHAYASELQLFSALEVYYEALQNNKVKLIGGKEDRKYYEYHDNSFMLVHDPKNKVAELPLLFAIEKPQMFVKKNKYILSGHLHSKKETSFISNKENFGIEHIQCPSLSVGDDKWHHENMYIGNKASMLSLIVDPYKGITSKNYFTV
jgi:hypothetical protein